MIAKPNWSFEKLCAVLDKSILLSGPIGVGPILPEGENATEYFEAIDFHKARADEHPKLKSEIDRLDALRKSLDEDRLQREELAECAYPASTRITAEQTTNIPFSDVPLFNQRIWDSTPHRATEAALDAIMTGGFDNDRITRRVGNYEGQIIALRRGWVEKSGPYSWKITESGLAALKNAERKIPNFLPAIDNWHSRPGHDSEFQYCVYEVTTKDGRPALEMMKTAIPAAGSVGMDPLLRMSDVVALRDYLNLWIERQSVP